MLDLQAPPVQPTEIGRLLSRVYERGGKGAVTRVAVAHQRVVLVDPFWSMASNPLTPVAAAKPISVPRVLLP